jgi:twitching motility protein PilT
MNIEQLLKEVVDHQGSDLHLTAGVPPVMRVWGKLTPLAGYPVLTPEDTYQLAYSMLNTLQKQKFEKNWELDLSYGVPGLGRFRVNVYRQRGAVGVAIRVIPHEVPHLEDLNLPGVLVELTRRPRGLILVTGPTGQGKSTTLAAMINQINEERSCHIVTIEDPIEYLHEHKRSVINQRELGFDTQSFPNALRAALREDPDVVLIGEMRDLETIAAALTIAETGHLVFATLHTANAAQSIDRIIDVFPPHQQQQVRVQLASVLEAVVSQILLPNQLFLRRFGSQEGYAAARQSGSVATVRRAWPTLEEIGRVPAVEVMIATPAIRNLIREGKTHQIESAIQTGAEWGMQTMDQSLRDLYQRGLISFEDAIGKAIHPEELRKMIA